MKKFATLIIDDKTVIKKLNLIDVTKTGDFKLFQEFCVRNGDCYLINNKNYLLTEKKTTEKKLRVLQMFTVEVLDVNIFVKNMDTSLPFRSTPIKWFSGDIDNSKYSFNM